MSACGPRGRKDLQRGDDWLAEHDRMLANGFCGYDAVLVIASRDGVSRGWVLRELAEARHRRALRLERWAALFAEWNGDDVEPA